MVEYTLHSRMRRAMTCVYWEPKSRMTICSFIGNEGEVSASLRGILREKNRAGQWPVVCCQLFVVLSTPPHDDIDFSPFAIGYQIRALRPFPSRGLSS